MEELKDYLNKTIREAKSRKGHRYDDPIKKASLYGYIEAMEEILEFIEDNE